MTGHEPDPALTTDLGLLDDHTARLEATAGSLADAGAPSLCEGWTRGHVLTHLARNAEAIGRLADWATTGNPEEMYPGGAARRDAEIEAGAGRGLADLRDDLAGTAQALRPRLAALHGDLGASEVEMRGGLRISPLRLPFMRLREVVYHHVDLDAGFTFADVADPLLVRFIDDAVERLRMGHHPPDVELRSDEGRVWQVGAPAASVSGSDAALLLWLARRIPTGIRSDGPVPTLPRGA
jgi:maleylpyruvate isomerase